VSIKVRRDERERNKAENGPKPITGKIPKFFEQEIKPQTWRARIWHIEARRIIMPLKSRLQMDSAALQSRVKTPSLEKFGNQDISSAKQAPDTNLSPFARFYNTTSTMVAKEMAAARYLPIVWLCFGGLKSSSCGVGAFKPPENLE